MTRPLLFTAAEAARLSGVSLGTIDEWAAQHLLLPTYRRDNCDETRYSLDDVVLLHLAASIALGLKVRRALIAAARSNPDAVCLDVDLTTDMRLRVRIGDARERLERTWRQMTGAAHA